MAFTSIYFSLFSPTTTLVPVTTMANLDLATLHKNTYITFIQTHRIIPTHPGHSQDQPITFHIKRYTPLPDQSSSVAPHCTQDKSPKSSALPRRAPSDKLLSTPQPYLQLMPLHNLPTDPTNLFLKCIVLLLTSQPSDMLVPTPERSICFHTLLLPFRQVQAKVLLSPGYLPLPPPQLGQVALPQGTCTMYCNCQFTSLCPLPQTMASVPPCPPFYQRHSNIC